MADINADIIINGNRENIGFGIVLEGLHEDGYTLGGEITPASSPVSTEDKLFYIAEQQGTYVNFGGITVAGGEIAFVYRKNNAWVKISKTFASVAQGNKADTAYQKPVGGIPKADMESAVQTSLGKADSSVQSVTVGTTTTVPAGTPASVTNTGTQQNPTLNFAIPRGADGANAVNPFKGWFGSESELNEAFPLPNVGDHAHVEVTVDNSTSVHIFKCETSGMWTDTEIEADTSNVQTFETGEEVNEVPIDSTNLDNPAEGSLAKAEDARALKVKLKDVNVSEDKATLDIVGNAYVSVTSTGVLSIATTSTSRFYAKIQVSGYKRVRFLGIQFVNIIGMGYGFFDSQMEPIEGTGARYDTGASAITTKEYDVIVPSNATYFCWTTKANNSFDMSSQAYAWLMTGKTITEMIGDLKFQSNEKVAEVRIDTTELENPASNSLAKAKDCALIKTKVDDVTFEQKYGEVTLVENAYIGSSGSINEYNNRQYAQVDVSNYSKVRFLGIVFNTYKGFGYAFYDENDAVIESSAYDYDQTLQESGEKEYSLEVPQDAVFFRWTTNSGSVIVQNTYAVIAKGKSITDMISDAVLPVKEEADGVSDAITRKEYVVLEDYTKTDGAYINNNGFETSFNNCCYYKYPINAGGTYVITTNYSAGSYGGFPLVWYFNDDTPISYELKNWQNWGLLDRYELTIPENTTHIVVNFVDSKGMFILETVNSSGYYDFEEIIGSSEKANGFDKLMTLTVNQDHRLFIRSKFDDENDILVDVNYHKAYNFVRNALFPQNAYIGRNNFSDNELITYPKIRHNIYDTIGPITMLWCGPIYANHGYSTPVVTVPNNHNLTSEDVGSTWRDDIPSSILDSDSGYREFTLAHISGNKVYLLPKIEFVDGFPYRDYVAYNSPAMTKIIKLADAEGKTGVSVGTEYACTRARYDYQVCECKDIVLTVDGAVVDINTPKTYHCNEVLLGFKHVCYDASQIDFLSWWDSGSMQADFTGIPIQVVLNRQFRFNGTKGYLSYVINNNMNVLRPWKYGTNFADAMDGRYNGVNPTAFLANDLYDSISYLPRIKKQYVPANPTDEDYSIDFTHEFDSNYSTHPLISFYRNSTDLEDVNKLPDRIYSYAKNIATNELEFAIGGGHSIVRGFSIDSTRCDYTPLGAHCGYWNPPVANKCYFTLFRTGDDEVNNTVSENFIMSHEGFFCWYKPQVTNTETGAAYHCFWYKSGDEYILYIHTKGAHGKNETVLIPTFMDGMEVKSIVEQKNNNIELLDDIVVANQLHVKVTLTDPSDNEECNYIVVKVK